MKLFVSYPSEHGVLAERLRLALEEEGHDVFTDRAELPAGKEYHASLRAAIARSDAAIFLITPRAVRAGSYTLTEIELAQRRWRRPAGRVLPVVIEATPAADIPPYLAAVTLLQPRGDAVAETVAAVAGLRAGIRSRVLLGLGIAACTLALVAGGLWWQQRESDRRAAEAAKAEAESQLARKVEAADSLCRDGSHTGAWEALRTLAAANPAAERVQLALRDCGMRWLRGARILVGEETFGAIVDRVQPLLVQVMATAAGAARADLRAHIGYGEFLRSRDNRSAPDPMPHYEAALAEDPRNVFALAWRAHLLVWRQAQVDDEARSLMQEALAAGRERAWVREIQWAVAARSWSTHPYGLEVADSMRASGETLTASQRQWLWNYAVRELVTAEARKPLLAALAPDRWLATLEWAFPQQEIGPDRAPVWRFVHALLRLHGASRDAAVADLRALRDELAPTDPTDSRWDRIRSAIDGLLAPAGTTRP